MTASRNTGNVPRNRRRQRWSILRTTSCTRSACAIKEALQRKDELNRIISHLDFGKDRYQFYIGKNKGSDGRFYDMFMDDALQIKRPIWILGWTIS